jgi:hypothetical protein
MTAPANLPPVRRPSPSGVHRFPKRRPWYGEPDVLCILAILLALAGIFPHAAASVGDIIRALRGAPVASAQPHQPEGADAHGGQKSDQRDGLHGQIMALDHAASTPQKGTP